MGRKFSPKKLWALLWALMTCVGTVIADDNSASQVRLFYSQDSQEVRDFTDGLKKSGHQDVTTYLTTKLDSSVCSLPGKMVSFGGEATSSFLKTCPETLVAFIASNFYFARFRDRLAKGSWGYFYEQPLLKQLEHADRNMPSIKTLGVIYRDDDADLEQIKALAKANSRVQVKLVRVDDGQIIAQVLRSLYEQVDAVLVTPNQDIWPLQDFKTFLLLGMRQGKIMIGGHNLFYTNRGVISSVHNDFTALGEQVGKELEDGHHPQMRYFRKGVIVTNQMLAARYGIFIGDTPE